MACLHMKKKLSEYLDGELGAEEITYVEGHIATCEDCAATLSEMKAALLHVRSLDEVEPPAWFAAKVMQRVQEDEGRESFLRKLFYPLHIKLPLEALALVLVAVLAYDIFDATRPKVAMQEAAAPEEEIMAAETEEPREETFLPSAEVGNEPFAATPPIRERDEEAHWDTEDIGSRAVAPSAPAVGEVMLKGEAKLKKEAPRKTETATDKLFRNAEQPIEVAKGVAEAEGQTEMGGAAPDGFYYAQKAVSAAPDLRLSVEVEDLDFAVQEVEDAIVKFGGKVVDRNKHPENIILGEIDASNVGKLIEGISKVGKMKSRTLSSATGKIKIRIELSEVAEP